MSELIIVDAGPLIAWACHRDALHRWALRMLEEIEAPLYCCEPVLAEVFWRLSKYSVSAEVVWDWIHRKIIVVEFSANEHYADLRRLMQRYADRKIDFADACLVRMSELHRDSRVFTCDGDFKIYRRNERMQIPLIFPD